MLFAKNGRQNAYQREKQNRNDEKLKTDSLVAAEEEMPEGEKRKLLLQFLEVFLKDETTNKETGSNPINPKENNWTTCVMLLLVSFLVADNTTFLIIFLF